MQQQRRPVFGRGRRGVEVVVLLCLALTTLSGVEPVRGPPAAAAAPTRLTQEPAKNLDGSFQQGEDAAGYWDANDGEVSESGYFDPFTSGAVEDTEEAEPDRGYYSLGSSNSEDEELSDPNEKRDKPIAHSSSLREADHLQSSETKQTASLVAPAQGVHMAPDDILKITRNTNFTIIASLCSAAAVFVVLVGAVCYVRLNKNLLSDLSVEKIKEKMMKKRAASGSPRGGAQHFEKANAERADDESEEEEEEGENGEADFTVYECEGPASAEGKMEIRNPMFQSKTAPDH